MERPDTHDKDMLDLMDYLERVIKLGEAHRKNGEGLKATIRLGSHYASVETVPAAAVGGGYRPRPAPKGDPEAAKVIVQEYADLLEFKETDGFYFVATLKRIGDGFDTINQKMRSAGFRYVRFDKEKEHTGGWRGRK